MNRCISLAVILVILYSCKGKIEPAIQSGVDECENCTMIINDADQGAVAIDSREEMHTFCSPVCMILRKNTLKKEGDIEPLQYFLFDHNDLSPVAATEAFIVHGDFNTAMGHGLLAFGDKTAAESFAAEVGGELLSWNDLRAKHETPDRKFELNCRAGAEPGVFEVARDEVVSVCPEGSPDEMCVVTLKGYDLEFNREGNDGDCAAFVADKPGQGFVFIDSDNRILASLHVTGDHTTEEALYK